MKISRQAWYQGCEREKRRAERVQRITREVTTLRLKQPRLGTRKLHYILQNTPEPMLHIGRDRLFTILRLAHLLVRPGGPTIKQQIVITVSIDIQTC